MHVASRTLIRICRLASTGILSMLTYCVSTSQGYAQSACQPQTGSLSITIGSCSDRDVTREKTSGSGAVVDVTGGHYTGQGVVLRSLGTHSIGLKLDGATSSAVLSDSTISTAGSHSYGIAATSGAQFVAEKVGITTSDDGADGVLAQNTGTEITLRNLDIVTQGPSARGIRVLDGAFVSAEQIAIVTEGSGASEAIRVENGSEMTLVDADISVLGSDSWGFWSTRASSTQAVSRLRLMALMLLVSMYMVRARGGG